MFVLNIVRGIRFVLAKAVRRTRMAHRDLTDIQPPPKVTIYKFENVLATGNKVCKEIEPYTALSLELILRAIHTDSKHSIIRTVNPDGNKTYTHTPSGDTLTVNNNWEIIDYSPK